MLPSSSLPGTPSPSPRKRFPTLRRGLIVLTIVLVVAGFAGVFVVVHGAGNTSHQANLPAATATSAVIASATDQATALATTTPGPTPVPTATTGNSTQPTADIRVTKNQNVRLPCTTDPTTPYTVVLYNAGTVTANWHVNVPPRYEGITNPGSQPLISPPGIYPYWADPSPQNGSVAPGRTATFVMTVRSPVVPCGEPSYQATVQLSFPSGLSQADIPLTYAGYGPARYSNVVLTSGSLNLTEACPASGSAPAPFTFAFKNTGNYKAYSVVDYFKDTIGIHYWATVSSITISPQEPDTHWLYAGETWTVTIAPTSYDQCGATYHIYIETSTAQGTNQTITITDTIQQ